MNNEKIDQITVHDENNIKGFFYDYRFLSNFEVCQVHFDGMVFTSSEAAYMAGKTLDRKIREEFTKMTPSQARRAGQLIELRPEWDTLKTLVMETVLTDKFTRNLRLKHQLLATGDKYLEETNYWNDIFWGVCNGVGENHLGRILMSIRDGLKKKIPKILVLTGAGISAESGIQTFRDMDGLWYEHKVQDVASIDGWHRNKQLVLDFYNERRNGLDTVEPNDAHKGIASLQDIYDVQTVTQNVDDLHEKAGQKNVTHLHGELKKMCSSRNKELTLPYDRDIKVGDLHPDGSQLRPYIVWFGEQVPKIVTAMAHVKSADIVVVIGTSLEVYPAAGLLDYAKLNADIYYIDKNPSMDNLLPDIRQRVTVIQDVASEGVKKLKAILKEKYA